MTKRLLIVGGSVRPLVASARRAGFEICAFDFFADWDAKRSLETQNIGQSDVPGGTIQRIDRFDDVVDSKAFRTCDAALIGGGFENRSDLVRRIAERMPVLGPTPKDLERIACPLNVFDGLRSAGFQVPESRLKLPDAQTNHRWLRKLARSSSGLGVRLANPDDLVQPNCDDVYFQQKIEGESISALYVSSRDRNGKSHSWLLGISRQLVGEKTFGAAEFRYCGSIGPIQISAGDQNQVVEIGRFVAEHYGILGVWGIDFVINQNGVWPVDVNPRITASAELLESSILNSKSSFSGIVDLHAQCCDQQINEPALSAELNQFGFEDSEIGWIEGKAVLFHGGETPVQVTASRFSQLRSSFDQQFFDSTKPGFSIADLPCSGQTINVGHPILTLRVRGHDENEVLKQLCRKAKQTFHWLGIAKDGPITLG